MRKIGLIGGMSAASTAHYYEAMNAEVRTRLGGLNAAEIIMWSVNFSDIARMQEKGQWDEMGSLLANIACRLEVAGADMIVLATNTMHKVADRITSAITVPFIHIADATANRIVARGFKRPGLMATAYTMDQDFYVGRLQRQFGLEVVLPGAQDRADTHRIIYDELCKDITTDSSRTTYEAIASRLVAQGADCLILGCTEVGILLNADNVSVPVFDTTMIHAEAAVALALADQEKLAAE